VSEKKRALVDIEPKREQRISPNLAGYSVPTVLAGKIVVNTSVPEWQHPVYQLLAKSFDIQFCTNRRSSEFVFYPVPQFAIFAVDSQNGCLGTIGGCGSLEDDRYPVGYVKEMTGYQVAKNLRRFFEMVTVCPCWREAIVAIRNRQPYDFVQAKEQYEKDFPDFRDACRQLADFLSLRPSMHVAETLQTCVENTEALFVYPSREAASRIHTFQEIN
jgi:hypothetical protein